MSVGLVALPFHKLFFYQQQRTHLEYIKRYLDLPETNFINNLTSSFSPFVFCGSVVAMLLFFFTSDAKRKKA